MRRALAACGDYPQIIKLATLQYKSNQRTKAKYESSTVSIHGPENFTIIASLIMSMDLSFLLAGQILAPGFAKV